MESKRPEFLSSLELSEVIRAHSDIPYYNQENVQSIALGILTGPLNKKGHFTRNLLRELDYYDYLSLQGDQISTYLDKNDFEGLLNFIPPGFSFELVTQADNLYPELIDHTLVILSHPALLEIAIEVIASSPTAFQETFSSCAHIHTLHNNAMYHLQGAGLFGHLRDHAERIHPATSSQGIENNIGFRLNCTYRALSDKIGAVFSPHGKLLFCLNKKEGYTYNSENIWLYNALHAIHSTDTSPALNTATCLTTYYNNLPKNFQEKIYQVYARTQHPDYIASITENDTLQHAPKIEFEQLIGRDATFENAQGIINSLGLEHEIDESTIDAFRSYIFTEIDTLETNIIPIEEIQASDIQEYIKKEYGLHDVSEEEIKKILSHISFFSITELESLLGATLASFKEKEVFAILALLQHSEHGAGITFLKDFLQDCDTPEERKTYLQTFGLQKFGFNPSILKQLKQDLSQQDYVETINYIRRSYESVFSVESFLRDTFPKKENIYLALQIKNNLLRTLKESFARIQTLQPENISPYVQTQAKNTINNTILFLETFKAIQKTETKLTLEDIIDCALQTMIPAQDIDTETRAQMIALYAKNHESESGAEALVEKFKAGFENNNRHLYTFSYKGTLLSFIAFDALKTGTIHASAFNVAPDVRGYKIGEAMMNQALNEQAEENILVADCVATLSISAKYIESGFLGTHFYMDDTDPILDIVRNDSILQMLTTRALSLQEILMQTLAHPMQNNIEMYAATSQKEISFEPLSRGFVLTRYLVDKNTGVTHVVFEKPTIDITQWSVPQPILDRTAV